MVLFFFTLDHIFQKKKKSRVFIYTNNKQNKRVNKKKKNNKFLEPEIIEKERTKLFLVAKTQEKKNIQEQNDCVLFTFFFVPIQWLFIKRCNWGNFSRSQLI